MWMHSLSAFSPPQMKICRWSCQKAFVKRSDHFLCIVRVVHLILVSINKSVGPHFCIRLLGFFNYWKCNFPMTQFVRLSVSCSVGRSVIILSLSHIRSNQHFTAYLGKIHKRVLKLEGILEKFGYY